MMDRIENDFYPTEAAYTAAMLDCLPFVLFGEIREPCAGDRAIVAELLKRGHSVAHTDIIDGPGLDATKPEYWAGQNNPQWVITNPPFNRAAEILEQSIKHADRGCIFFLRLTFAEPVPSRSKLLRGLADHLRWVQVVNPRPMFRADTNKTDSVTCAWFCWDKHWSWRELGIDPPFQFLQGRRSADNVRRTEFPDLRPSQKTVA